MRTKWYLLAPLLLVLLSGAVALVWAQAPQQSYSLSWWTVDGGGARSTATNSYTLDGTAGQADAGPRLAGGNYLLNGGFWPGGAGLQVWHDIYLPIVMKNHS